MCNVYAGYPSYTLQLLLKFRTVSFLTTKYGFKKQGATFVVPQGVISSTGTEDIFFHFSFSEIQTKISIYSTIFVSIYFRHSRFQF